MVKLAIVQGGDALPTWLVEVDKELRGQEKGGIAAVIALAGRESRSARTLKRRALRPLQMIEARAVVPPQADAIVASNLPEAKWTVAASNADLIDAISETRPDIVVCEGDTPFEQMLHVASQTPARVWCLGECWTDIVPPRFVRACRAHSGYVDIGIVEVRRSGAVIEIDQLRLMVPPRVMTPAIHQHFWAIGRKLVEAVSKVSVASPAAEIAHMPTVRVSTREVLALTSVLAARRLAWRLRRESEPHWWLAFGSCDQHGPLKQDFASFKVIDRPPDRFWADPFVIEDSGRHYVFFEELLHSEGRGRIAAAEIGPSGIIGEVRTVLAEPWHLSYPQLLRIDGHWHMIPESGEAGHVTAYVASEFPLSWKKKTTLLSGVKAFDATLFEHGGRWWMFATLSGGHAASNMHELHLFHADHPLSEQWLAHPANPILTDITAARPAGAIIRHGGRLYRPSQDCRHWYGYGLVLNEIEVLSETRYEERPVRRWLTGDNGGHRWRGLHTYNTSGPVAVIDVLA